jgi:hypothetical protein
MAGQIQQMEARGELLSRNMQMEKTQAQLGMARADVLREEAEKQAATKAIIGGVGSAIGSFTGTETGQRMLSNWGLSDAE